MRQRGDQEESWLVLDAWDESGDMAVSDRAKIAELP